MKNLPRRTQQWKPRRTSTIVRRMIIGAIVVLVVALPLIAVCAQPLIAVRVITTPKPQPRLEFLGNEIPQIPSQFSGKTAGAGVRVAFADGAHGDGKQNGLLGEFTLDGGTATAMSFYDGSFGTGYVSAMGFVDGRQLQTLNWSSDWTLWAVSDDGKRVTRKAEDQYSVPANEVMIPLTKRSAIFAGFGKVFTAKASTKNRLSLPSNSEMMRVEPYTIVTYTNSFVYVCDVYTGEISVYRRTTNGQIDQASKTLVTYVSNVAAMAPFGNDLFVYVRRWDDDQSAAFGSLLLIPNASSGNALPAILDEKITAFNVDAWIGSAFTVVDDGTGSAMVVTVDHRYSPMGNADQIAVRTQDGQWHEVPLAEGMYITALRAVPQ